MRLRQDVRASRRRRTGHGHPAGGLAVSDRPLPGRVHDGGRRDLVAVLRGGGGGRPGRRHGGRRKGLRRRGGELPVPARGDADLAALVAERRTARRAGVPGTTFGRVHEAAQAVPRGLAAGPERGGVPGPPDLARGGPAYADPGRRRRAGDHAGDIRADPPADPPEAVASASGGLGVRGAHQAVSGGAGIMRPDMAPPFGDRLQGAIDATEQGGLDALLVTPSADLAYLCGYDPPPFERLTCLVLRPGSDPVLLVPELERPRAAASPAGERIELAEWKDGEDPYEALARLLPRTERLAVTDTAWTVHLLGLQRAVPGATWRPGSDVVSSLRVRKDPQELELLSRAARGAD